MTTVLHELSAPFYIYMHAGTTSVCNVWRWSGLSKKRQSQPMDLTQHLSETVHELRLISGKAADTMKLSITRPQPLASTQCQSAGYIMISFKIGSGGSAGLNQADDIYTARPDGDLKHPRRFQLPKSKVPYPSTSSEQVVADDDMGRGGVFFWLLLAGIILLSSCTSPAACSSRLIGTYFVILSASSVTLYTLAAAWQCAAGMVLLQGANSRQSPSADGAKVWAAGVAAAAAAAGGEHIGGERVAMLQRLSRPPSPVPNTPRSSAVPGPPPS
jgi:hypothetical protein